MSYINDALRKAQQDKKSPYTAYEPLLSAAGKKNTGRRQWLALLGLLALFFCAAAGLFVLIPGPETKKAAVRAPLTIPKAPVIEAPVQPAVKEITVENKVAPVVKTAEKKTQKTEENAELKTRTVDSVKLYAEALRKHQEGNLEQAKDLYKKVIEIDPKNIEALNNLGVVYMKKKTYKWAIIRLNDALKIKHDYPDAHYNLACIYAQNNDLSRSLSYLKNAIGFNPQVRQWAEKDKDLEVLADLPEFKKLLEKN